VSELLKVAITTSSRSSWFQVLDEPRATSYVTNSNAELLSNRAHMTHSDSGCPRRCHCTHRTASQGYVHEADFEYGWCSETTLTDEQSRSAPQWSLVTSNSKATHLILDMSRVRCKLRVSL
jgi:hypothetical protein